MQYNVQAYLYMHTLVPSDPSEKNERKIDDMREKNRNG